MTPNWFIAFPMQVEGLHGFVEPPPRVRVFVEADLHCTVAFLGGVASGDARQAWRASRALEPPAAVKGTFGEVRPLGNPRRPSALAAIVEHGRTELSGLTMQVRDVCLEACGAPPERRAPLPHMTLARVQRRASNSERRAALAWATSLDVAKVTFSVSSIALYTWADDRTERLFQMVERAPFDP